LQSELFFHDLYLHLPELEQDRDLSFEECLAFLDFILTENSEEKSIIEIFKMIDRVGNGHINTNELLLLLKKIL
jgi:Ca2+-binding EF-hand superfamily protein